MPEAIERHDVRALLLGRPQLRAVGHDPEREGLRGPLPLQDACDDGQKSPRTRLDSRPAGPAQSRASTELHTRWTPLRMEGE
eukprot:3851799-Pyramimonas_sp.AAC.1